MADQLQLRMFGGFSLSVNQERKEDRIKKSKKGLALLLYLILQYPAAVSNERLISVFAKEDGNPESALKTLISRFRSTLNQCYDGLGSCIIALRGGYQFQLLDGMTVDLLEFWEIAKKLEAVKKVDDESLQRFHRMQLLVSGELLQGSEQSDWIAAAGAACHEKYMEATYRFVAMLVDTGAYSEVIQCCRFALEKDPFNERLHLELMNALVKLNRRSEALEQYRHVSGLHFRYLGAQPPESLQTFYQQMIQCDDSLETGLDTVCRQLEETRHTQGAFECSYPVFREVYDLQMRNLQRLNASMYIAMMTVAGADGQPLPVLRQEEAMGKLGEILRRHLRKGDTLTRYSAGQYCVLLPAVNDETGQMVIERIKRIFYQHYPESSIVFYYRIRLLDEGKSGTVSGKKVP